MPHLPITTHLPNAETHMGSHPQLKTLGSTIYDNLDSWHYGW